MRMGKVHEEESHPAILLNFEWAFFGDCSTLWEQGSTKPNLKTISEGGLPSETRRRTVRCWALCNWGERSSKFVFVSQCEECGEFQFPIIGYIDVIVL